MMRGRISSPALRPSGVSCLCPHHTTSLVLVCWPGGMQGLLPCVLHLVRGRTRSPTHVTLGPGLSPDAGVRGVSFPHPCHHMADER